MEINQEFDKYMDSYYEYNGLWDSPSKCGLKKMILSSGKTLIIATEIYRQNPGTPVTEWVAPLATKLLKENNLSPDLLLFIEHTPDLRSKLTFYGETFDVVNFDWDGEQLLNPQWTRISREVIDKWMKG